MLFFAPDVVASGDFAARDQPVTFKREAQGAFVLDVLVVEALQGLVKKGTVPLPAFILLDNLGPARGTVPFFKRLLCIGLMTPALGMIGKLPLGTNACRYCNPP